MSFTAFSGFSHVASGTLPEVYASIQDLPGTLIFDEDTGRVVDIDPRFPPTEDPSRPGRPRVLGVLRVGADLGRCGRGRRGGPGLGRCGRGRRGDPDLGLGRRVALHELRFGRP